MLLNITWLEWIGYLSSVIVAISLTMRSIVRLRWYNLVGSAIFSFYGFMIGSLPVGILNLFIVLVNLYYLRSIYSREEAFRAMKTDVDDSYLKYYFDFYKKDILKFFPDAERVMEEVGASSDSWVLLLLRDAQLAGILVGKRNGSTLHVYIDYVTAPYRDLKTGEFVYKHSDLFKKEGIKLLVQQSDKEVQQRFLSKMGFVESRAGHYELLLH
ncbi:MAG: hypothetical protein PHU68_07260 [Paludibacter sp.]|jgi:uncharacterized membrane protein|nr:hypothetical protein [Paludibacter sp.]